MRSPTPAPVGVKFTRDRDQAGKRARGRALVLLREFLAGAGHVDRSGSGPTTPCRNVTFVSIVSDWRTARAACSRCIVGSITTHGGSVARGRPVFDAGIARGEVDFVIVGRGLLRRRAVGSPATCRQCGRQSFRSRARCRPAMTFRNCGEGALLYFPVADGGDLLAGLTGDEVACRAARVGRAIAYSSGSGLLLGGRDVDGGCAMAVSAGGEGKAGSGQDDQRNASAYEAPVLMTAARLRGQRSSARTKGCDLAVQHGASVIVLRRAEGLRAACLTTSQADRCETSTRP